MDEKSYKIGDIVIIDCSELELDELQETAKYAQVKIDKAFYYIDTESWSYVSNDSWFSEKSIIKKL